MTRDPVLPAVRAAVFTAVCLGLGAGAHLAMSGAAIPAWALLLGGGGVYVPARLGAGRERGLLSIMALMGMAQVALHFWFAYAQHAVAASSMSGMAMPQGAAMPGMTPPVCELTWPMLAAHAAAAFACAWWLRRGEAAAHTLLRAATSWVRKTVRLPTLVVVAVVRTRPARRVAHTWSGLDIRRSQWLRTTRILRGPPAVLSFD
jgi:hypothetical protein